MESLSKPGCKIKNQKDPYQFQCVFSNDPEDRRDFSVYFKGSDGRQDLMVRCTYNEKYECTVRREGLSVTEDYISVSETFSEQNGSFVCRNGGPPLEKFPCFYSGTSIKPEMKYGTMENGSSTFLKPEDGTEDNNNEVIIGASLGVVIIILCLFILFLLYKMYTSKKRPMRNKSERENNSSIEDTSLVATRVPLLGTNQNEDSFGGDTAKTQKDYSYWLQLVTAFLHVNDNDAINEQLNRLTRDQAEPNDSKRMDMIITRGLKLSNWEVRGKHFIEISRSDASKEIETQPGQFVQDVTTDGKLRLQVCSNTRRTPTRVDE